MDIGDSLDAGTRRSLIVEANDGIMTAAGVIEGFAGAGATGSTVVIAAVSALVAGSIVLAGARYAEEAAERDILHALIEEEERQLARSPDEERDELIAAYRSKGLSERLAAKVADELMASNPVAASLEATHGISRVPSRSTPIVVAIAAGLSFAAGAVVPLLSVLLLPDSLRAEVTALATIGMLVVTSSLLAHLGGLPLGRTLIRTLTIASTALGVTSLIGRLIEP